MFWDHKDVNIKLKKIKKEKYLSFIIDNLKGWYKSIKTIPLK
jgi:hypothetical protein